MYDLTIVKNKIKLSDIAEKLNVSAVTISKALTDKPGVSDSLREKIKLIAEEMGYVVQKDRKPRSDSASYTGNIGIIIPVKFFNTTSSFYLKLFNFVSKHLLTKGMYSIIEQLESETEKNLVMPQILQNGKVDGVIFIGQISEEYVQFICKNYNGKMVFLDFYAANKNVDCITTDNFHGEYQLTKYLIDMGHKDIRFVGTLNTTSSINDRYMGYAKAMMENGLSFNFGDVTEDRNMDSSLKEIILPDSLPTAFVCNCDETAVKVIKKLETIGKKVPDDISVVGFDDFIISGDNSFQLTTIAVNFESMAESAAEMILDKLKNPPTTPKYVVISGKIIIRNSVRNLNS